MTSGSVEAGAEAGAGVLAGARRRGRHTAGHGRGREPRRGAGLVHAAAAAALGRALPPVRARGVRAGGPVSAEPTVDPPAPPPCPATCCLSLFVVGIDAMAVNLALPSIRAQIGASPRSCSGWSTPTSSSSPRCCSCPVRWPTGSGRRRVFNSGLIVFGLGSLLCSLATSPGALIVSRALQAVGGSMLNPVAMSIITNTFDDPRSAPRRSASGAGRSACPWRPGRSSAASSSTPSGGRRSSGSISPSSSRRQCSQQSSSRSRAARPRRFDPVGQALLVMLLGGATFAIIEGRALGWGSPVVLGCLVGALGCGMLFVRHAARVAPRPRPGVLPEPLVLVRGLAAILGFSAMSGFLFLNTLYLQEVRGYTPLAAGLLTVPMAGMTALCSPVSGSSWVGAARGDPLVPRRPRDRRLRVLLEPARPDTSVWVVVAAYLCFGIGFGTVNAPVTYAAVSGMPRSQAGVAAAVASTSRQVGAALGVAVFGAVTFAALGEQSMAGSFAAATHLAWWLMVGCGAGLVTSGCGPRGPLAPPSTRNGPPRLGSPSRRPVAVRRARPRTVGRRDPGPSGACRATLLAGRRFSQSTARPCPPRVW